MKVRVKRAVVIALAKLCCLIDRGRPFTRCYLAEWSDQLDQRWGTGVWVKPNEGLDIGGPES